MKKVSNPSASVSHLYPSSLLVTWREKKFKQLSSHTMFFALRLGTST